MYITKKNKLFIEKSISIKVYFLYEMLLKKYSILRIKLYFLHNFQRAPELWLSLDIIKNFSLVIIVIQIFKRMLQKNNHILLYMR